MFLVREKEALKLLFVVLALLLGKLWYGYEAVKENQI